jgi:hypothetical protein
MAARPAVTHYIPPKSNKGLYLGIFFGGFAIFLVIAAYLLFTYAGTKYVEVVDPYGNVIWKGRCTPEEAQKKQEEASRIPEPNVVQLPAVAARPKPTPRASNAANPSLTMGELTSAGPLDDGNKAEPDANKAEPAPMPEVKGLAEDPKITAMTFDKVMVPASDIGTITGMVCNKYDSPLQDLQLTPQIVDPNGRVVGTLLPYSCSFVPAGGTARYSTKFDGIPEELIGKVRISAKAVPMEEGMACQEVENPTLGDPVDKVVPVTGNVKNNSRKTLTGAYVYVEFFARDWVFIKSVKGTIISSTGDPEGRLLPGGSARFKAEVTMEDADDTQRVKQAVVRLVGKEE